MIKKRIWSLFVCFCILNWNIFEVNAAQDETLKNYAYYGLEPDIVTNYISDSKKLGFVRVNVELMVSEPQFLAQIEHHDPLLRAAILEILGKQGEEQIKSIIGKEAIRQACFEAVNRLLEEEVGEALVVNLLFTQYLYN
ncbi:flagellar basal body-associated protein FliL [uncultured Shewanella sp.]|uniref:flagellar basal body-associated protein FliL n=1 Tax=uncultured Shewanella sp. TaxID=173975 RepID=UPI0026023206|nr:flagellar basal body-associated protein FliL [uncultured Shewanella sp.]